MVQIFMWESSKDTLGKCRKLRNAMASFFGSPCVIKGLCGGSMDSYPIIFCWVNSVELFD